MQILQIVVGVYITGLGASLIYIRHNRFVSSCTAKPVEKFCSQLLAASLWFIAVPIKVYCAVGDWWDSRN